MLILPPLTALFLTLQTNSFQTGWLPRLSTPHEFGLQLMIGERPSGVISRPEKDPMLGFRLKAELQPDAASFQYPRSRALPSVILTITPPLINTAPTTPAPVAETWEPPTRPEPPFGRRTGMAGFSSAASDGDAGISLSLFHPWLGMIYISAPGFIVEPGGVISYPFCPFLRPVLPQPVTPAEPGVHLSEGELLAWPYQTGCVTWITHF